MNPVWKAPRKKSATGSFAYGGFVTDQHDNVVRLHDDHGAPAPQSQDPMFRAPLFINVESQLRDKRIYPDSRSFELHFPTPLRGVRSVELIDLCVPNAAAAGSPVDKYFFVANGLIDYQTAQFGGQGLVGVYEDMNAERTRTCAPIYNVTGPCVAPSAAGTSYPATEMTNRAALPTVLYDPVGRHAFGKFFHNDSTTTSQIWERNNVRKIFYFRPEQERLGSLQFSLVERDGKAYDHATTPFVFPVPPAVDDTYNWTATLVISAQQ